MTLREDSVQSDALAHPDIAYFGLAVPQVLIYSLQNAQSNFVSGWGAAMTVVTYAALSVCLLAVTIVALRGRVGDADLGRADIAAALIGSPLVLIAAVPFYLPMPLRAAASCGTGFVLGWMYVRWAPFYARLSIGDAIACVFISMASGSLVKLAGDLTPALPRACAVACLPALSFCLLRRAERVMPAPVENPLVFETGRRLPLSPRLLIGVASYALVIGASRGLAFPLDEGAVSMFDIIQHFAEVGLAGGIMWWVFGRMGGLQFSRLWNVSAMIALTGLFLVPALGREGSQMALAFVYCAQTLTVMLLWLVLADVARHDARSPYAVFGIGWLAYSLPCAVGEVVGLLARQAGVGEIALLVLGYGFVVACMLVLTGESFEERRIFSDLEAPRVAEPAGSGADCPAAVDFAEAAQSGKALPSDAEPETAGAPCTSCVTSPIAPNDSAGALADRFGLTPREVEVACLLARGRSKTYIAENLFVSENTVRSHTKHIYAKMGIHSRQELMDLVDEAF